MSIDTLFEVFDETKPEYIINVPKTWGQGRTLFGGITTALAYQAAENLIEDDRALRSLHCNFVGPLNWDEPVVVTAEVLRTGRNVTQLLAKVCQNGQVGVMAQICFGMSRESKLLSKATDSHVMNVPKKGNFIPNIPKLVPAFIQHYNLSLHKGSFGLGKSDEAALHGWSRYSTPPKTMRMTYFIALMDAWPPTMLQMLRLPAPASTMSWDIEFINPKLELDPAAWYASETEAQHIQDGYGHEEAKFWDQNGNLLALSRQVVTVFA